MPKATTRIVDPGSFEDFLSRVRIAEISIESCGAVVENRAGLPDRSLQLSFGDSARLDRVADTEAEVLAYYAVEQRREGAKNDGSPKVAISVEYRVRYETPVRMSEELFEQFRKISLRLHIIPFAREWIYETSHRMGIKPILLPLAISHPAAMPRLVKRTLRKGE